MTNSRQKGARGERELAAFLTEHGFSARRGQQFKGTPDSPDVIVDDAPELHIECKRVEAFRLYPSLKQAEEERGGGQTPVVCHKKNREEWVAVLYLKDFLHLVRNQKED